jgi:hypothetical protein
MLHLTGRSFQSCSIALPDFPAVRAAQRPRNHGRPALHNSCIMPEVAIFLPGRGIRAAWLSPFPGGPPSTDRPAWRNASPAQSFALAAVGVSNIHG